MRTFDSGATRDGEDGKLDFDGFLSPGAIHAYADYMNRHRIQPDGSLRAGDNWKKGIPIDSYRKSMWRHFFAVWSGLHPIREDSQLAAISDEELGGLMDDLSALLFNVQGVLHHAAQIKESRLAQSENGRSDSSEDRASTSAVGAPQGGGIWNGDIRGVDGW